MVQGTGDIMKNRNVVFALMQPISQGNDLQTIFAMYTLKELKKTKYLLIIF